MTMTLSRTCTCAALLVCLLWLSSGCTGPGGAGRRDAPAYRGLQEQTVAVMVWADRGIRIDYPPIKIDLSTAVQEKLSQSKSTALGGTTFPHTPATIVRFQQDNPLLQRAPITEVAPLLGASRVIYIELEEFDTRSYASTELFRGSATATLRVVEVENGQATIAYEEREITTVFPPNVPREGLPRGNDLMMYRGTIDRLSDEIVNRFVAAEHRR